MGLVFPEFAEFELGPLTTAFTATAKSYCA